MPDDLGGLPFPDGDGPDSRDHGGADEAFASVVLDEHFVEAAEIHEPTAAERVLYAALERAEAEAAEAEEQRPRLYRDPDLDPGHFDELTSLDSRTADDDEGRFDRSDYTRYLRDDGEGPRGETPDGLGARDGPAPAEGPAPADGPNPSDRPGPDGLGPAQVPDAAAGPRPHESAATATWWPGRWQRPVACVLAVVMGISVIAFALVAIQRASSAQRGHPAPVPAPPAEQPTTHTSLSGGGP